MDFSFTEEEERFRQEVREFLKKELLPPNWDEICPSREEMFDRDDYWAMFRQMQRKLGSKGYLSLAWPKEYGGQARSFIEQAIFAEEIAYHRALGIDVFGVKMLSPTLLLFGTEEQKKTFLPPIAKGEIVWCQGYSEPNAGSDLASVQTRAEDKGDHFLVNGQKIWTTGAHRADWQFLLARTDPTAPKHRGISFLMVDMKTPGITVRPLENAAGEKSFCEVFYDSVRIPKENLLGEKNGGWRVATALLNAERSGVEYIGNARRLLEELIAFVNSEEEPLCPILKQKLAELSVEIETGRLLAYRTAWLTSRGQLAAAEASMSKVYGTELLQRLAQVGMEILGLYCQLKEGSPWTKLKGRIEGLYLSCLGPTIAAGTSEIQRNIIAWYGLNMPRIRE